jgi:hypothetical protein
MYKAFKELFNYDKPSCIGEVAFHPGGECFLVTYRDNNQVRMYDAATFEETRVWKNPDARLDWPEGICVTEKNIVVSSKHRERNVPTDIDVYRFDGTVNEPRQVFRTPDDDLRTAHSIDIGKGYLVCTYCSRGSGRRSAIVSYIFDEEAGVLSDQICRISTGLINKSRPKGITLRPQNNAVYITFDRKPMVAGFRISEKGVVSEEPFQIVGEDLLHRPENIKICNGYAWITDTTVNKVFAFPIFENGMLGEVPEMAITEKLSFPHGLDFSPDGETLVVTNFGLKTKDSEPLWGNYLEPRQDKLVIFRRANDEKAESVRFGT